MSFDVPLIIRGRLIEGGRVEFAGRSGEGRYTTPDLKRHLGQLPLSSPG